MIYINKIGNIITLKIKKKYYLELLTSEKMKLRGSTEDEIAKDKNCEVTGVVLVHCNIVNKDYQQDSRVLYTFIPNKPFSSLSEKIIFF